VLLAGGWAHTHTFVDMRPLQAALERLRAVYLRGRWVYTLPSWLPCLTQLHALHVSRFATYDPCHAFSSGRFTLDTLPRLTQMRHLAVTEVLDGWRTTPIPASWSALVHLTSLDLTDMGWGLDGDTLQPLTALTGLQQLTLSPGYSNYLPESLQHLTCTTSLQSGPQD
jgi:hypothetical protein